VRPLRHCKHALLAPAATPRAPRVAPPTLAGVPVQRARGAGGASDAAAGRRSQNGGSGAAHAPLSRSAAPDRRIQPQRAPHRCWPCATPFAVRARLSVCALQARQRSGNTVWLRSREPRKRAALHACSWAALGPIRAREGETVARRTPSARAPSAWICRYSCHHCAPVPAPFCTRVQLLRLPRVRSALLRLCRGPLRFYSF